MLSTIHKVYGNAQTLVQMAWENSQITINSIRPPCANTHKHKHKHQHALAYLVI
jgi:hypothetical protein